MKPIILFLSLWMLLQSAFADSFSSQITKPNDLLANPNALLASTEGEPSSVIHGCVSVISGDYHDAQTDLIIPGCEPLVISRHYSSADHQLGTLFTSWNFNIAGSMICQKDAKKNMATTKGGGGELAYQAKLSQMGLTIHPKMLEKGVVNTSSSEISARTNIKNHTLYISKEKGIVKTGSGIEYQYNLEEGVVEGFKDYAEYRLIKTIKPNGNTLVTPYEKGFLVGGAFLNRQDV